MDYSIDMNFFFSKDNLVALHFKYYFWRVTATAGSDVVQSVPTFVGNTAPGNQACSIQE